MKNKDNPIYQRAKIVAARTKEYTRTKEKANTMALREVLRMNHRELKNAFSELDS